MQVCGLSKLVSSQFYGQCKYANSRSVILKVNPFYMNAQPCSYFSKFYENLRIKSFSSYCFKFYSGKKFHIKCRTLFSKGFQKVPNMLKKHSVNIVKTCSEQCEFVLAHRVRRGYQIFNMYSKLWGEVRLWLFLNRIKQQLARRSKELIFSAALINYNWDKERISDDELTRHSRDFERIYRLQDSSSSRLCSQFWQFSQFKNSDVNDKKDVEKNDDNSDCDCSRCQNSSDDGWVEFYKSECFIAWKKEEVNHKGQGLYCYKIYGCFDDITAEDYFRVHCDTEFRKEWDKTAVQLEIIDSDEASNSDVIYWELLWPRMFSNRDYVFKRRFKVDNDEKLITVVNESTVHPNRPEAQGKHRVKEYWSYMVIKPRTEFHEPGLEFGITYFDNPGLRIPYAVSSWVTYSGLSEYIKQQHEAALLLSKQQQKTVSHNVDNLSYIKMKDSSKEPSINISPVFPTDLPAKNFCI